MLLVSTVFSMCISLTLWFQSSQTTWPVSAINRKFYDLYIANRSYEEYYRSLFEHRNESNQNRELSDMISKHFLVAHVYMESEGALDIRDKPQLTSTAFLSQLGGALNLWAGITVVIVVELIELCYEVVVDRFNRKSSVDNVSWKDHQQALCSMCGFHMLYRYSSCWFWLLQQAGIISTFHKLGTYVTRRLTRLSCLLHSLALRNLWL